MYGRRKNKEHWGEANLTRRSLKIAKGWQMFASLITFYLLDYNLTTFEA